MAAMQKNAAIRHDQADAGAARGQRTNRIRLLSGQYIAFDVARQFSPSTPDGKQGTQ